MNKTCLHEGKKRSQGHPPVAQVLRTLVALRVLQKRAHRLEYLLASGTLELGLSDKVCRRLVAVSCPPVDG